MTENRERTINVRQCDDGQEEYIMREELTSPTVTTKAILITRVFDAKEKRQVAVVDLCGAFLHAENDHDIIMFIRGRLPELMTMVAPQTCQKFVSFERRQRELYVKEQNEFYGMLKSALLFYKKMILG